MIQVWELAFSYANILPTAFFLFIILYWIIVLIGVLDFSFLDFDVELDIDADIDADVNVSVGSIGWLNHVLIFFNLGRIPFMIWLSFLVLPWWFLSIPINAFFGNSSFLIGLLFTLPILIVSLFISKVLTIPFIKIFNSLNHMGLDENVEGKTGIVTLSIRKAVRGEVKVYLDDSVVQLNAIAEDGGILMKGTKVLVIRYDRDASQCSVVRYEE